MPARDPTVDVRDNPGVGRYEVRADDALAPVCPFIAGFISRHADEYLGLVVPEMRARIAGMAR